ncbi:LuxR C-terminal-related transcriptional regulator [Kordia sp.]|uniref:helix-turn-helix and ligand-binding sensor domain-containing protein n=1 Tax=Kordia sp. TaxID=1965332 RepID=UPI003D27A7EF
MQINSKKPFILLLLILSNFICNGQHVPFFQNYSLTEFGAGNKNWGVTIAESGEVFVANDLGLLEFDGVKWDFYQLPNKTIIRSVLAHKELIFTGSYEEFGYWKKNLKGKLIYTSLSDLENRKESFAEEFWQIIQHKDSILFRSFSSLYIYKNGKVSRAIPQSQFTILSCDIIDDRVFLSTENHGIFELKNGELFPIINHDVLSDLRIVSLTKLNNKLLITTALKGCFLYDESNKVLHPWEAKINNTLKAQQLNSFKLLENGDMIFGTIKNGVYVTDNNGNTKYHINKENGLLNNTVLSIELDKYNNLWLGLDNGMSKVNLNYNYILYSDNSGKLGAVYDVVTYANYLYLASNTGLFYLNKDNNNLEFVEGSQGQVWDLKVINNQLLCGHNNGTYLVQGNKLKRISDFSGGWVLKKIPELTNSFIQGTYGGLVRFDFINGEWKTRHLGSKIIPAKYIVFEDYNTAWVAHAYKGLFRVIFNETRDSILSFENYKNKGLWSDFNIKVHKIKNDICFKTNEGWQKYEVLLDSIVPHDILNNSLGKDTDIISETIGNELVVKNDKGKISFISLTERDNTFNLPRDLLQKRLVVNAESVSRLNDSTYTFNLYDGYLLINKRNVNTKDSLFIPEVKRISLDNELVEIIGDNKYEFPYNKNFTISVTSPLSANHFFEYSVTNTSEVIEWVKTDKDKLELSGLSNGDYKIHFRTSNFSGETSDEIIVNITILPPWYKNGWFYIIVGLLGCVLFYWLHKKKIKKEQRLLHNKLVKEQEILLKEKVVENDRKIVQLKNESLKSEVKLKSKQLANTAMALVKKNESILEIRNELVENENNFQNTLSYKRLLRKIDNSINHEDEWELFEYNFNQVHKEFFDQLKLKHPKLTHKDLKICAYIKMNLLTKEIAPLMNISIRGLETHRYRLKRKLNLENDKSLSDYLRSFK